VVIDTSALLAILFNDPDAVRYEVAIEQDPSRLISAATVLETGIVVEARYGEAGGREFDLLLHKAQLKIVTVTPEQVEIGRAAFRTFGKGRHPAGLNYGNCFSYA
jgi:ribonuclease VapC